MQDSQIGGTLCQSNAPIADENVLTSTLNGKAVVRHFLVFGFLLRFRPLYDMEMVNHAIRPKAR